MRSPKAHRCAVAVAMGIILAAAAAGGAAAEPTPRTAPVVGAEFPISDTAAATDESAVAVASSGAGYLVVWEDLRDEGVSHSDIYGQLVSATGVLVGDDFRISGPLATAEEKAPAVAWNGSEYLVVWEDTRNTAERQTDIYGRRVSAAGVALESDFRITGAGALGSEDSPAVAWSGTEYLVAWEDTRNTAERKTDIYGRRVSAAGDPEGTDFRISGTNALDQEYQPAVVWGGTEYLVIWEDSRDTATRGTDVRGRRVSAAGEPEGKDFRISGTSADADDKVPQVAWSGTEYLVVWEDWRMDPGRQTDIYGRRVSAAGAPIGANFRICGPGASGWDWVPGVAWDDGRGHYLVVWQDERDYGNRGADIYGRRLSAIGARLGGDFRISGTGATSEYSPAVAWGGAQHLVVWQDARGVPASGRDIYGRRVELPAPA